MTPTPRHVPWHVVQERLATATPIRDAIPGDPRVTLDIEPEGCLALCVFVPWDPDESLPPFLNLECDRRGTGLESHVRFACSTEAYLAEFYAVIQRTADRVQLDQMRVDHAIRAAADEVEEMLQCAKLLSPEQQVGLWGELRMLSVIAARRMWSEALDAWAHASGLNEEHDFRLPDVDSEVKTTTTERRVHALCPTQLTPSPGRRLLLCSIQVTPAGDDDAESLAALIARLREVVPPRERVRFDKGLFHAGWVENRAKNYALPRWRLRSTPVVVSAQLLPTLEPKGTAPERIVDFRFHLSLAGLESHQEEEWVWE